MTISIEAHIQALEATGNYRILKRFEPQIAYHPELAGEHIPKKIGIFLDTETTGMDAQTDDIIEIAMLPFEYDLQGRIYRILPAYSSFNQASKPISPEITHITGITDQMIQGHHIDPQKIEQLLHSANIIIAHHASFDRPFCEKLFEGFKDMPWGCSLTEIDWKGQGMESMKLSALASAYGFFYEGHRALIDCQVGIDILSRKLPQSEQTALQALLQQARQIHVRLWAENAPFDSKDILKNRGYRWNPLKKTWYIDIPEDKVEAEIIKLNRDVYPTERTHFPMEYFDAKKRHSGRG